jgi:acyl-CoA synthetase (AMP-forming)/AMP-acid ligase II
MSSLVTWAQLQASWPIGSEQTMLLERIYEWARSQPKKTAIIYNDVPINYASFSRAIDAARRFLEPHALPAGRTAIVLFSSPLDGWILLLALRSFGFNTICVRTIDIDTVEQLKLRDVAFVVVTQSELNSHELRAQTLTGAQVIVVPTTIYANVHTGEVPVIRLNNPPFGGHIIFTSGTTSRYKKLVLDSTFEDRRNETRARIYSFSKDTITNERTPTRYRLGWRPRTVTLDSSGMGG